MEYRALGGSGLHVSRIGLGTMAWGRDIERPVARELVHDFIEGSGNLIDTASAYGGGVVEQMIGKLLATDILRDPLAIATKAGFVIRGGRRTIGTSRTALPNNLEGPLCRLRTDRADLWQVHAWGDAPTEETLSALDSAVSRGLAHYVRVSNFVDQQTATVATWQEAMPGRTKLASVQVEYSLLARRAEVEATGTTQYHTLGLLAWSAMGRGILTGRYRWGIPKDSRVASEHFGWFLEPYLQPRSRAVIDAAAKAADGLALTSTQVVLMWVRDTPQVASTLIGPRTPDHLAELLEAETKQPVPSIVVALDDIPGGSNQFRITD